MINPPPEPLIWLILVFTVLMLLLMIRNYLRIRREQNKAYERFKAQFEAEFDPDEEDPVCPSCGINFLPCPTCKEPA